MAIRRVCDRAHCVLRRASRMEKHKLNIKPGEILVEFLAPIDASQYTFESETRSQIACHDELAAALPPDQRPLGFPGH